MLEGVVQVGIQFFKLHDIYHLGLDCFGDLRSKLFLKAC